MSVPDRLDDWLILSDPVTYWSLWSGLLGTVPIIVVIGGGLAVAFGTEPALVYLAPVPFVYTVGTLGFAVRDLDSLGIVVSISLTVAYGAGLGTTELAWRLLTDLAAIVWLLAPLVLVAGVAGFMWPSLHPTQLGGELGEIRREQDRR